VDYSVVDPAVEFMSEKVSDRLRSFDA
jgi:hypothetical protein